MQSRDKPQALIIGGSGFVGTRLSLRLQRAGTPFLVVDKRDPAIPDMPFVRADVTHPDSLAVLPSAETIVNLAAEHRDDVRPISRYQEVNVDGARHVCEMAERQGIHRIVFTSSVAVYGFAPEGTDESGKIDYFNEYGRTKYEAEQVYRAWQSQDPERRSLVIIRPTVIFGEGNRGNVYNLLRQIATRRFVMIGPGRNRKSMAYVENVAALLEHAMNLGPGARLHNYVDGPDMDMNSLVSSARRTLFQQKNVGPRLPTLLGYAVGYGADAISRLTGKRLPVSAIRVRKFLSTTSFRANPPTGFSAPIALAEGLERTLRYEFIQDHPGSPTFETE